MPPSLKAAVHAPLKFVVGPVAIEAAAGQRKRFRMLAYSGGALNLAEYAAPVVVDLAGVSVPSQTMPILAEHVREVGKAESITIGAKGVEITGYVDDATDDGKLIIAASKGGFPWEASIGATVQQMDEIRAGETVAVNGQTFTGPLFVARKTTLQETSFVKRGADTGRTSVSIAATLGVPAMDPKFEAFIKASGFDPATVTEPQKIFLKAAFDAAQKPPETPPPAPPTPAPPPAPPPAPNVNAGADLIKLAETLMANFRKETAAEQARVTGINAKCAEHPDIAARAIGEGWTVDRAELEVLRASRPTGFNVIIHSTEQRTSQLQILQAAMILRSGGALDNPSYQRIEAAASPAMPEWLKAGINTEQRQKIMLAAHRFAELSAIDLCRHCIAIDGKPIPDGRELIIQAAFSGNSFNNIFTTSMYARLISGFLQAPDTTAGWTQAEDVMDFKINDEIRLLTLGGVPQKLPRGTEAKHITRSDEIESFKLNRYAAQCQVDEQDMIDDRLGAILQTAPDMGIWFSQIPQDLVYAIVLANPALGATGVALFADANSPDNLRATSALTAANLKPSIAAMQLAQENSRNLSITPTHILVPPSLQWTAAELMNSTLIVSGNTAERGNTNTLQGLLEIVREVRLENGVTSPDTGVTSSGSATTWYLASTSPGTRTIKRIYRSGTGRAPHVRPPTVLTKGKWGMNWDINFDVGAAPMDYRALQKNTA